MRGNRRSALVNLHWETEYHDHSVTLDVVHRNSCQAAEGMHRCRGRKNAQKGEQRHLMGRPRLSYELSC
jgi:hypothetical protein